MGVSLIMPTFGRCDEIHRLLDSLERQTAVSALEVIIVDQNPEGVLDSVLARLSASAISYKYILSDRKGLSIARNMAFSHTRYEIVGYPDDDCWYEDNVIGEVIRLFANNRDMDGLLAQWCEVDMGYENGFSLSSEQCRQFRMGVSASSICIFMRREQVEEVAGFDERLGVPQWFGAGEETDFIMRCLSAGANIRYEPSVRVHHAVKSTDESDTRQILRRVRKRSRGTGALYRKHRLPGHIISRGLLSPLLKAFLPPWSLRKILVNLATISGRLEGMFYWRSG